MPRESSTPTATIAHEGNPRTNSLTISGTLDGDIFLIPLAPSPDAISEVPRPLPPPPGTFDVVFESNPGKYILTGFNMGTDGQNAIGMPGPFTPNDTTNAIQGPGTFRETHGVVVEYSKRDNIPMYGMIRSPRISSNGRLIDNSDPTPGLSQFERSKTHFNLDFLQWFNLLVEQSAVQPGDRWGELPGNSAVANILIEANAYVSILAIGYPFSGVAVCVSPTSTHENFTGIVCAYNWGDQKEYVMRYRNQPLSTFGTILTTTVTTNPVVNDAITLRARKLRSTGLWTIVTNVTSVGNLTDSDIPYFDSDMRVALVNLPPTVASNVMDDFITWTEVSGIVWAD